MIDLLFGVIIGVVVTLVVTVVITAPYVREIGRLARRYVDLKAVEDAQDDIRKRGKNNE